MFPKLAKLGVIVFAEWCWLWICLYWVLNLSLYREGCQLQNLVFPALYLLTSRCINSRTRVVSAVSTDFIKHTIQFAWARGFRWTKQHFCKLKYTEVIVLSLRSGVIFNWSGKNLCEIRITLHMFPYVASYAMHYWSRRCSSSVLLGLYWIYIISVLRLYLTKVVTDSFIG